MTLRLDARLSRSTVAEGEPAQLYLLVQVTAPQAPGAHRPPLNLAAVVDRSGSMAGAKLAYTKQALAFLLDQTLPGDHLAVITFDHDVEVLPEENLGVRIAQIADGGSTNLSGGLLAGYREARRRQGQTKLNRVLLLTDGQANVGITDPGALTAKARELYEKGIQLSTLGVGADFHEDLLSAMAEAGGGNFHYIANPDELPAIFATELQGLLATAAQGLELQFRAAPGVTVAGVVGYPPSGPPDHVTLPLPDLNAGQTRALVLALDVEPAFAGERWLGRLELTYTAAADATEATLALDPSVTVADSTAPEEPDVLKQVHLARAAEAIDRAIHEADGRNLAGAAQALREAAAPLAAMAPDDPEVARRMQELQAQADALESSRYDADTRKQMRAQSFRNRRGNS